MEYTKLKFTAMTSGCGSSYRDAKAVKARCDKDGVDCEIGVFIPLKSLSLFIQKCRNSGGKEND